MNETTWLDIAARCSDEAIARGFAKTSWNNFPSKLMFIVSEMHELAAAPNAVERNIEAADIVIRTLASMYELGLEIAFDSMSRDFEVYDSTKVPGDSLLAALVALSANALEYWRDDYRLELNLTLESMVLLACSVIGDETQAKAQIIAKLDHNLSRPFKHGRKQSLG